MPIALHSFKIEEDGVTVHLKHTVYAETEEEAYAKLHAHADICPKFGPAYRNNQTREITEEIDELPTVHTLDDFVAGEPEEEEG